MSNGIGKHRANVEGDLVIVDTLAQQFVARLVGTDTVRGATVWKGVVQNKRSTQTAPFTDALTGDGLDLRHVLIRPETIIETVQVAP